MITAPEVNIKLDEQQQATLTQYQQRLANFEHEITLAQKHLLSLKHDCELATKDRSYQTELLATAVSQSTLAQAQLSEVQTQLSHGQANLTTITQQAHILASDNQARHGELNQREANLISREELHAAKVTELDLALTQLAQERLLVDHAKTAFLQACQSVVWK